MDFLLPKMFLSPRFEIEGQTPVGIVNIGVTYLGKFGKLNVFKYVYSLPRMEEI